MKRFVGIGLATVLVTTTAMPVYAGVSDELIKKQIKDALDNTTEQVLEEVYGEDYYELYTETYERFLKNIGTTVNLNYNIDTASEYEGETYNTNVNMEYNDDGKSILANFVVDGTESGNVYINDKAIAFNFAGEGYYYEFGSDTGSTEYTAEDAEVFKYSNVKEFLNNLMTISDSKLVEDIYVDYMDNLNDYLAKGDYSKDGENVSVEIDSKLMEDYLVQLKDKINNDKNIDKLFNELDIYALYSNVLEELNTSIDDMIAKIDDTANIIYNGKIKNGMLVDNKVDITFYGETISFVLDFNDSSTNLLSDASFKMVDPVSEDEFVYKFDLKDEGKGKQFTSEMTANDEVQMTYDIFYQIDGDNIITNIETNAYVDPYFYQTEEPVKPEDTTDEWAMYEYELDVENYNDYKEYIAGGSKKQLVTSIAEGSQTMTENEIKSEIKTVNYTDKEENSSGVINYTLKKASERNVYSFDGYANIVDQIASHDDAEPTNVTE